MTVRTVTVVAVMGMPRVGVEFPRDTEFGQCEGANCIVEIGWSRECPDVLRKLCPNCVSALADEAPLAHVMMPSGQRSVEARRIGTTVIN